MKKEIFEILKSTGMTDFDAKKHIQKGVVVYDADEFIANTDEYLAWADDEEKQEIIDFVKNNNSGSILDNDVTIYNGIKYYIEYTL